MKILIVIILPEFRGDNLIEDNVLSKVSKVLCFETIQASRKLDDTKMDKTVLLLLGFLNIIEIFIVIKMGKLKI